MVIGGVVLAMEGMVHRIVGRVAEDAGMIDVGEKILCLIGSIPRLLRWDACFCYTFIVSSLRVDIEKHDVLSLILLLLSTSILTS